MISNLQLIFGQSQSFFGKGDLHFHQGPLQVMFLHGYPFDHTNERMLDDVLRCEILGGGSKWLFKELESMTTSLTPLKINGWNMSSWRFGSDHFPFFSWVMGCRFLSPLIFQGLDSHRRALDSMCKTLVSPGLWRRGPMECHLCIWISSACHALRWNLAYKCWSGRSLG